MHDHSCIQYYCSLRYCIGCPTKLSENMAIDFYPRIFNDLRSKSSAMYIKFHVCILVLGLCDNGKSDISISVIIFYRFISINDISYLDNAVSKTFSPQCAQ